MSGKLLQRAGIALGTIMLCTLPLATEAQAATPTYGYAALQEAKTKIGAPYRYGATGPYRFDCSGLTQYSFEHSYHRHYLHRTAYEQWRYDTKHIYAASRRLGDLIFFWKHGKVEHVGIYAGYGKMIEANASSYYGYKVIKTSIAPYWSNNYGISYGRVL